jgi:phage gp45-like
MNPSYSQILRVLADTVDDSGPQQLLQVKGLTGQVIGEAVRSQPFGFASVPPSGGEGLMLALGGGHDRGHVIGLEHPAKRPTAAPAGSATLYDSAGNQIRAAGATIFVKPKDNSVIVYLGGDGSDPSKYDFVATASGPSVNVKARIAF